MEKQVDKISTKLISSFNTFKSTFLGGGSIIKSNEPKKEDKGKETKNI